MGAARDLKIFAIIINVLILLVGASLIGVGIFVLLDNHGMIKLNRIDSDGIYTDMSKPGTLDVATVLTIVAGSCLFVTAVGGFFGVCAESRCFLGLFIGGLVLASAVGAATLGTSVAFTHTITDDLRDAIDQGIRDQFEGHIITDNAFSKAWDETQIQFECCGLNNYTDFLNYANNWWDRQSVTIPKSCCHLDEGLYFDNNQYVFDDENCGRVPTVDNSHIEKTCYTEVKDWLEEKTYLLLGMAIVGLGAELLGVLVTTCLLRDIQSLHHKC